jgi:hypothetical protein
MDNDTYDDRHSRQQKYNENIVKRLEEIEDFAQTAALEANARFDIGIENRTEAFKKIQKLEDVVKQQSKLIDRTTTLIDNMAESMLNHLMAERSAESNKDKEYSYIEDGLPPF